MVILGFPAQALPHNPGFNPPQQQKPTERKLFNQQISNNGTSSLMILEKQYCERGPQPREENKKDMQYTHQEKENPGTTVVYIHALDPYATESSSDEGEQEETVTKKRVRGQFLHVVEIQSKNNDHASSSMINHEKQELASKSPSPTEKDDQAIQDNGGKSNKVTIHEKKNNGDSSSLFTSSPCVKEADFEVKKELVLDCCTSFPSLGLCDVPGPIPDDLDILMQNHSLALNFFKDLPDS